MLLQKIHNESEKSKSGNGLKIAFYLISIGAAYLVGYYQHPRVQPVPDGVPEATLSAPPSATTPADEAATVPLSTPVAIPSPTPALIGAMPQSPPPVRVEKAVAITPLSPSQAPSVASPSVASPSAVPIPAATPEKQANQVTITEAVEIPVKQDGKITGYINLQKGQLITPVSVDHDQIKVKSGEGFVMVPIKSTDMAH
jgi:hypothetical protein